RDPQTKYDLQVPCFLSRSCDSPRFSSLPGLVTVETVVVTVLVTLAIVATIQLTVSQPRAVVCRRFLVFTVVAKVVATSTSIVTPHLNSLVIARVQSRLAKIV